MAKRKELTNRDRIEALLTKVAKTSKAEVIRAVPHGASKSGIGALQVRREGAVLISVRDKDVVIYVEPKVLKAGRPGPKGWESVAHFNHNTPLEIFEKSFKKAFTSKKVTGAKPKVAKDISARRKQLETQLATIKAEEKKAKATKSKAKASTKKPKTKTNKVTDAAIASVAAEPASN